MRDLLTGRLRALTQSPDGFLHDAQPPASIGVDAGQLGADGRPLVEPGAFFCDGNYSLAINSWNALAGVAVTLRMRWLSADGRTTDSEFVHTPNTNRTKATSLFPLGVGFALNVTVFASTGTPLVGQTFIQVQIVRGLTGALLPVATLLQDYVTSVQAVAWPGSPIRSSIEGGGYYRDVLGAVPAAGAEITETVPAGARWEVIAVLAILTTAAGGVNRFPALIGNIATRPVAMSFTLTGQPPASGYVISWNRSTPNLVDAPNLRIVMPLPDNLTLLAGDNFHTSTTSIAGGDQWGAPNYIVREWLEAAS